jgi:gliding motility-associated-like protein
MKFKKFLLLFLFFNCSFIYSQSPIVSADGIQLYCPGTKLHVATSFSITPAASETGQKGLYIQISQGYVNGEDTLSLLNPANFPDIDENWSNLEGKLTLTHKTNPEILYSEIEALLYDVVFESNSINPQKDKTFSISVGDANYLPSEDHYYKYIAYPTTGSPDKRWTTAKTLAENERYYGLKGYLATLATEQEAILAGIQAPGQGWIGASDAIQEGKWEWVTGPEGNVHFWNGNYEDRDKPCDNLNGNCTPVTDPVSGQPMYNNWHPYEPNEWGSGEDYGHIYGSGSRKGEWNDYSNSNSSVVGYIVEFGGSPGDPTLSITDFTEIIMPRIIAPSPIVPEIICGPDTVTFTVQTNTLAPTNPLNDIEVQWYDSVGNLLETGLSFTTQSLNSDKTFYALPVKYNGTTACTSTANRIPFEVIYYEKPELIVPSPQPFEQCNNTLFDLVALQSSLSINAATETFEFFDSSGNLIASPSSYTFTGSSTSNQETINVIITSNSTAGLTPVCNTLTNITLKLGACDIPSTFPVLDEAICETSTDPLGGGQDGYETFDKSIFSNIETALITAEPLFGIFGTEINFYRSDADATAGVSTTAIDKTADYTTSAGQGFDLNATENRWEQQIWVRVENTTLGRACFDTQQVATLYINKLPELKPNPDPKYGPTEYPFIQCNDGIFNLTTKEKGISSNYANEEFEYYDSSGNRITDPTNYEIPALVNRGLNEIINVTIKTKPSLGTACVNTSATINLEWALTLLPAGYTLKDEYLVETDPDPKGQGQDGIETFDKTIFAAVQAGLIAAETRFSGKTFSFYRSENDALTSFNKIDTTVDFTTDEQTNAGFTFNTAENRWEQQIWVYVEDSVTSAISTCYGLYHIATVYVEKRPVFYDVTMQELCDEQTPLDMYSEFSTTSLFSEFTTDPTGTVTQDTSLFTVEYTYVDDTGAPKTGPTLPSNFNTKDQTITVTLTNNSTNTTPPAGVSSGTIEFKVYQQPVAYPSDPSVPGVYTFVECDDDNDGLAVGEEVFDMSSITTRLLTDISGTAAQDPNDFDFEYSVAGTTITLGSDYTARTGDQIEVKITNPLYPVCEETITIDFVVNPLPSFDIDDTTVICLNLTQPVEIGTSNWNGAADHSIYTYSWTLDSDPSFSEATETIFPVKGGIYTVVVEDPITFCTQTKSITVTESNIASIDLDDDGDVTDTEYDHFIEVLDLTDDNTNTIKIDHVADLGIGDYEFSLDNFNYQDDNEFTDLDPGVYTLYIRDKNSYYGYTYGCGILEIKVSVIGYKKYFTPNNDGINDKWKILGIRTDFNNASEIYIFDKHGKLLKQLDPITDGWDGTYLGKPMPATDYWFRVYLSEDGREFKGHFSLIRGKY